MDNFKKLIENFKQKDKENLKYKNDLESKNKENEELIKQNTEIKSKLQQLEKENLKNKKDLDFINKQCSMILRVFNNNSNVNYIDDKIDMYY